MKFVSKRDWWISVIMLCLSLASMSLILVNSIMIYQRVFLLLFGILVVWLYFGTYYVIDENFLILKCGPLKVKISYENIISIKSTKNMISSIALSTDKLKLKVKGKGFGTVYISPRDKIGFIEELSKKCTELRIEES